MREVKEMAMELTAILAAGAVLAPVYWWTNQCIMQGKSLKAPMITLAGIVVGAPTIYLGSLAIYMASTTKKEV